MQPLNALSPIFLTLDGISICCNEWQLENACSPIVITLDGNKQQVIFSDNGPGIHSDDVPYIFEAFYSGKEEGRGLGLYIARQLLSRMGYSIELADIESDKILSGANFVINFIKLEKDE